MGQDEVRRAEVEWHLDRVLGSAPFRGADRSARLLRFIVTQTLDGRGDQLKDYTLGAEALGRGADFDPRADPIARVEASRLRSRLDAYYAGDGAQDRLRIHVPKGAYVPQFEQRPTAVDMAVSPAVQVDVRPSAPTAEAAGRRVAPRVTSGAFWLTTGLAVAALLAWWLAAAGRSVPTPGPWRLDLVTPATTDPASMALAPDGRAIVFVASAGDVPRLWVRRFDEPDARPVPGTEHASWPFFSPDGRAVGFFANGRINAVDLQTRVVRAVSVAPVAAGGAWGRGDVILHPVVPDSPLFRTTAGGRLEPATALASGQTGHRGPAFLPDGRRFVFHAAGTPATRGVYLGELGSLRIRRLFDADAPPRVVPPSTLLYVQGTALLARRFEPTSVAMVGDATTLAEHVGIEPGSGLAALATAPSGAIAYRQAPVGAQRQLAWFDRTGARRREVSPPEERGPAYGAMSPDGQRFAVQRTVDGNTDIWVVDLERGLAVRTTSDARADVAPAWSPTGDRIVYASQLEGTFELFEKHGADGAPRLLWRDGRPKQVTDWSRDGRYLLYRVVSTTPRPDIDIWALDLDGRPTPFVVLATPFEERDAQFSPDGRYIAYQSNESGRHEVYVQPFPGGERLRVSVDGGVQARWRADGRELFYLRPDGHLMAVPMSVEPAGTALRPGAPVPLFRARLGAVEGVALHSYSVAPDGQAFLMDVLVEQLPSPIRLLLDWHLPVR